MINIRWSYFVQMKKVNHIFFKTIIIIELCCCFCFYEKLHWDHNIIKLSDIESLKKENITLELVTKDFNEISEKTINLKNTIENEINKINELYEKTIDELTKSYLIKHEELIKKKMI